MIGPGGLLLVVSHLFALLSQFQFYGWGCKRKKTKLDVKNIFAYWGPLEMRYYQLQQRSVCDPANWNGAVLPSIFAEARKRYSKA
jgi:hypothetical protein